MGINVGDVFRITHNQTYLGVKMKNVYFYEYTDNVGTPEIIDVAVAFEEEIVPEIIKIQEDSCSHDDLVIESLMDKEEWLQYPLSDTGLINSGLNHPSWVAVGFKLIPRTRVMRPGGKRIGGIPEDLTDGNAVTSTYQDQISDISLALGQTIQGSFDSDVITLKPVLVRYTQVDLVFTIERKVDIVGAIHNGVTTQRTRIPGSGS